MKTKKELNALKEKVETQNKQRRELTDEELEQVTGGVELPGVLYAVQHGHNIVIEEPGDAPVD